MFQKKDNTYAEIREKSVLQWLDEMGRHDDIEVRGGVRVSTDYILDLKRQINDLEKKNKVKDSYLKKMKTVLSEQ